tara:strand:+ start:185 stop:1438 length:1254 start_codon:yes stop_codon:yes gene_type:complete
MINFCIYEDDLFHQLEPLTSAKPSYCLHTGAKSLLDRFLYFFSHGNISLHCRDFLVHELKHRHKNVSINQINTGSPCLFINGRVLMTDTLSELIMSEDTSKNFMLTYQNQVVALFLRSEQLLQMKELLNTIPSSEELILQFRQFCKTKELDDCSIINHPWDLVSNHLSALSHDFSLLSRKGLIKGDISSLSVLYNDANMNIDTNVNCEAFVLIDARKGPVIIEQNVSIQSHSRLEGPLYIAEGATIKSGTILSNSSIGKYCKIGGEVHSSIFHSYSNKSHTGFCGHSIIGEWVNMGAGTTISNLKNNYGTVRIGHKKLDTGQQFCGAIVGDHVKLGIGTLLNCGTRVGLGSSLTGTMIHTGDIPLFSWGEASRYEIHKLEKFLTMVSRMTARRNYVLNDRFPELIQLLHGLTKSKTR